MLVENGWLQWARAGWEGGKGGWYIGMYLAASAKCETCSDGTGIVICHLSPQVGHAGQILPPGQKEVTRGATAI